MLVSFLKKIQLDFMTCMINHLLSCGPLHRLVFGRERRFGRIIPAAGYMLGMVVTEWIRRDSPLLWLVELGQVSSLGSQSSRL